MTRALVTGANGFIGSNLTKLLAGKGWAVRGLVLKGTPEDFLEGLDVDIVYGDIVRPESLGDAVRGVDVVFHLAAIAADWGPVERFFKVNVEGTRNMLEAAAGAGVGRFVFMSSPAVHRYSGHYKSTESVPRDCPADFAYGRSKIEAEDLVNETHKRGVMEGVIVRTGLFPFGPNDTTSFYKLARVLEKGMFCYVGGGRAKTSTAYVENLCSGVELAGSHPRAAGRTFIIADDVDVSWKELIERFCYELGVKPPQLSVPYGAADILAAAVEGAWSVLKLESDPPITRYRARLMHRDLSFVSTKACRELGYAPAVSLDEGIRRTVAWYKSARGKYG